MYKDGDVRDSRELQKMIESLFQRVDRLEHIIEKLKTIDELEDNV